jgi:hypothetical protein
MKLDAFTNLERVIENTLSHLVGKSFVVSEFSFPCQNSPLDHIQIQFKPCIHPPFLQFPFYNVQYIVYFPYYLFPWDLYETTADMYSKRCDIRHLRYQRVSKYSNFPNIRRWYRMCTLVHLWTSCTDLTIAFSTCYPTPRFPCRPHFLFQFHYDWRTIA